MIETVILYILNKYDASIYKVSKIINELFFAYLKSSLGTISPALKRLEKLSCVEFVETMSDGGLKTKKYSITKIGKNHLKKLLLSWNNNHPFYIITEAKIAIFMRDVLNSEEKNEFNKNIQNQLELYKIKMQNNINNEYLNMNDTQKATIQTTIDEINGILKLL